MAYNGSKAHLENLKLARLKASSVKKNCTNCNKLISACGMSGHLKACLKRKICPVCSKFFNGKGTTCSHGCANTHFRTGKSHPNWKDAYYRSTCFAHHDKKCVICNEKRIVEVHHMDENRNNNNPENLIPLCPTHHKYFHSRYRHLVIDEINQYIQSRRLEVR